MSMQCPCSSARSGAPSRAAYRPGVLARLGPIVLAIAALGGLAACSAPDATAEAQHRSAATAAPVQSFIARPVQRLLFTVRPSAATADAEAYVKANILPALARDPRIGDVAIYGDLRTGGYVVELELRTLSPASLSLALEILAAGRTEEEARKIIDGLARYFDVDSVEQLIARPDLSVSRRILGTIDGGSR